MESVVMLIVSLYFAGKEPVVHKEPMPDVKVCLQVAEEFLNHYDSSEATKGASAVSAMCGHQFAPPKREEKS